MPESLSFGKTEATGWLNKILPDTPIIVDVGCGVGTWGRILKTIRPQSYIIGIEIWKPYIEQYDLYSLYDEVINTNIVNYDYSNTDLVIFGDVLEHMDKNVAINEFKRAKSRYKLISIPIRVYEQGIVNDNPYEVHVYHWSIKKVLKEFGVPVQQIYDDTIGVFLYDDERFR